MSLIITPLSDIKAVKANFVIRDFMPIPKYAVTLLSASGGTGKTRLSLIMADRFIKENNQKVALWLTEDYPGQVRATVDEMADFGLIDRKSIKKMNLILNEPPQLAKRENGLFKSNYDEIISIGKDIIDAEIALAVFDPLLAFYGGNENDNSEARVFIQAFAEWAKLARVTTVIVHHSNKEGASRGATAFHDGVRARYELSTPKDKKGEIDTDMLNQGFRLATIKKDNWGAKEHLWKLTKGEDSFLVRIAPPAKQFRGIEVEEIEFNSDENAFFGELG